MYTWATTKKCVPVKWMGRLCEIRKFYMISFEVLIFYSGEICEFTKGETIRRLILIFITLLAGWPWSNYLNLLSLFPYFLKTDNNIYLTELVWFWKEMVIYASLHTRSSPRTRCKHSFIHSFTTFIEHLWQEALGI